MMAQSLQPVSLRTCMVIMRWCRVRATPLHAAVRPPHQAPSRLAGGELRHRRSAAFLPVMCGDDWTKLRHPPKMYHAQ